MGIDSDFGLAYAKSQMAAGNTLPTGGNIFISVRKLDKHAIGGGSRCWPLPQHIASPLRTPHEPDA